MILPGLVMKFGGTSVADADCIRRAADLVLRAREESPAVVVSAAGGVTDLLLGLLEVNGKRESRQDALDALEERHRALLADLDLPRDLLDARFGELRDLVHGVQLLREVTPRTCDLILSYGEMCLAPVFAAHLSSRGLPARQWHAGDLGLITDDRFTRARPLPESYDRIAATLREVEAHVPVVTGFVGRNASGQTTTLGRGGSDYTAAIVARSVKARELQIWTDVDGILTADPRLVPHARLIQRLSFREASELAYSGAKVLHPSTILPAMDEGIPVRVLNTRHPDRPGTTILDLDSPETVELRSIAHKTGVQVITVFSPRMLARHGFISRIADVFDRCGFSIDMISTSEVSVSLTVDRAEGDLSPLLRELGEFSTVEVEGGKGMVSVVGGKLGDEVSLIAEILRCVASAEAEVEMISYGATRTNLSFLVPEEAVHAVVGALHRQYFE